MSQLFQIRTFSELIFLLTQQQTMTRTALLELDDLPRGVITPANQDDEEYLAEILMAREADLLKQYAVLPTLTELERKPELRNLMQAGATFSVAALVGEIILAHLRTMANVFTNTHRLLLMVMLHEFDKPVSEDIDLVETFIRSLKVEIADSMGAISAEERNNALRRMLQPLAEAMLSICGQYRLIEFVEEGGWALTPEGFRVMLHLFDAQRFIDSVADAHRRFQKEPGPQKSRANSTN